MQQEILQPPILGEMAEGISKGNEGGAGPHALEEVKDDAASEPDKIMEIPPPKIACGLPRWLLLMIYSGYAFLTGAAYFNWTPMADMLYKNEVYQWQCTAEELRAFSDSGAPLTRPRCKVQELAVGRLFSAMSASEFGFAAIAGYLLDTFGPRLTGMIATLMALSGWILLAVGREGMNTFVAASVLLGGSSEMCFYPLLPGANLYPGRESTVMAIFGTCRSISLVIPLIMRAINVEAGIGTFREIVLIFACVFIAGCFGLALVFLPRKAWPRQKDLLQEAARKRKADDTETLPKVESEEKTDDEKQQQQQQSKDFKDFCRIYMEQAAKWCRARYGRESYLRELCSFAFAPVAVIYIFIILVIMFYVPSTLHLIPEAYKANQIIQIFSFVPCPLFGYTADRIGILWVMQIINFFGFCTYFFAAVPRIPSYPAMQYISAIFSALQVSFMNSQLYCYGNRYLSERNMGKLIGTTFCLAGFISLSTNAMRKFALEHGFAPMCGLAMGLLVVVAMVLAFLQFLDSKNMLIPPARAQEEKYKTVENGEERSSVERESDVELARAST